MAFQEKNKAFLSERPLVAHAFTGARKERQAGFPVCVVLSSRVIVRSQVSRDEYFEA